MFTFQSWFCCTKCVYDTALLPVRVRDERYVASSTSLTEVSLERLCCHSALGKSFLTLTMHSSTALLYNEHTTICIIIFMNPYYGHSMHTRWYSGLGLYRGLWHEPSCKICSCVHVDTTTGLWICFTTKSVSDSADGGRVNNKGYLLHHGRVFYLWHQQWKSDLYTI